jgi:hypothetical protein
VHEEYLVDEFTDIIYQSFGGDLSIIMVIEVHMYNNIKNKRSKRNNTSISHYKFIEFLTDRTLRIQTQFETT